MFFALRFYECVAKIWKSLVPQAILIGQISHKLNPYDITGIMFSFRLNFYSKYCTYYYILDLQNDFLDPIKKLIYISNSVEFKVKV